MRRRWDSTRERAVNRPARMASWIPEIVASTTGNAGPPVGPVAGPRLENPKIKIDPMLNRRMAARFIPNFYRSEAGALFLLSVPSVKTVATEY